MESHFEVIYSGKHFVVRKRYLKAGDKLGPKHDDCHRLIYVIKGQIGVQVGAFSFKEYSCEETCAIRIGLTHTITAIFDSTFLEVLSGATEDDIL